MEDGTRYSRGVRSFEQDIGRAAQDDDETRVTDPGGGEDPVAPLEGYARRIPGGSGEARSGIKEGRVNSGKFLRAWWSQGWF